MRDDVVACGKRLIAVALARLKELDRGIEIIPANSARAPDSHDSLPVALSNDPRSSRRATNHSPFSITSAQNCTRRLIVPTKLMILRSLGTH
jgi:hypothetical protein